MFNKSNPYEFNINKEYEKYRKICLIHNGSCAQLFLHDAIEAEYFSTHLSSKISSTASASSSVSALYICFKSPIKAFKSLYEINLVQHLIWCTIHLWISVRGNTAWIASPNPLNPSTYTIKISSTPRFFISLSTDSQYFVLSLPHTKSFSVSV